MRRGNAKERIDVDFNTPRFQALRQALKFGVWRARSIKSLATYLKTGFAAGLQDQATGNEEGVPHLRPLNLLENGNLSLEGTKKVPFESVGDEDLCQQGEVLFNNTNSPVWVGKSTIFDLNEFCACSNHITRIGCSSDVLQGFLVEALNTLRAIGYFKTLSTSFNNQAGINTQELGRTEIPLPPLDIQRRLVDELDAARAKRDHALAEAERLLASIDEYVLGVLAILPESDDRRVFAVRLNQVKPRLDADYHSPYFQRLRRAIEQSRHATKNLGDLTVFMRSGFAAGRQDQARGDEAAVPHLRPLNLNAWGELSVAETKSVPETRVKVDDYLVKGEVLFNNTNSAEWVGKTAVFDLDIPCACSNHMTRIALNPDINPYFVAALLNAFRGVGYFAALSTFFNNQAGINTNTLAWGGVRFSWTPNWE
ncbi:hypothetical protein [Desulfocurvus vexinensis]|uniref:hypothetical protein n=1 Tax=Desulfocurvus vexinensis TaxID=399548 RepID=UPI0004AE4EEB|nr:hypothetical protein [Desulfocurvus vexinensis]